MTKMTDRKARISGGCGANLAEPIAANWRPSYLLYLLRRPISRSISLCVFCSDRLALIGFRAAFANSKFDLTRPFLKYIASGTIDTARGQPGR